MAFREATSRRRVLAALVPLATWYAATAATAATVLAGCSSALGRLGRRRRIAVGTLEQLRAGGALRAPLGGDESVIVVDVAGSIRAFRAVCTHEGCPLGWNAQQHLIRCPCHGGAYDTSGRVVGGPPPGPLTALQAIVDKGVIYIVRWE